MAVDVSATRALYSKMGNLSPECCLECAVVGRGVSQDLLPERFATMLASMGVDTHRPTGVWGAADKGFLQFWYPFVGTDAAAGTLVSAQPVDEASGVTWLVTDSFPTKGWADALPQVAVELTFSSSDRVLAHAQEIAQ
jgi:hypothetical protein